MFLYTQHTIDLNIYETRSNKMALAVNPYVSKSPLIKEDGLWVDDLAISGPQVILHYLATSQDGAVVKLGDPFTHSASRETGMMSILCEDH